MGQSDSATSLGIDGRRDDYSISSGPYRQYDISADAPRYDQSLRLHTKSKRNNHDFRSKRARTELPNKQAS